MTASHGRDELAAALFDGHYVALRRLAFVILGDGGSAEEVVMDTFVKVCSDPWRFRRLRSPSTYLRRAVINACRSRLRRKRLERRVAESPAQPPTGISSDVESRLDVMAALQQLPLRQRACACLRYLEDLSESQIADILDCSVGTVKSQLFKARRTLRELLQNEVEGVPDGRA
ncbi:MAG: RNA polymerase sigma factor [Actinomycetota bacterium]